MLISRKTMSGSRLCTMATASRPLLASPTITSSGQACLRLVIICSRIRRSSSATTAVGAGRGCMLALVQSGRGCGRGDFVGHFDGGTGATPGRHADDQLGAVLVQRFQPLADIGQSHAAFAFGHKADASVEHMDGQLAVDERGTDLEPRGGSVWISWSTLAKVLKRKCGSIWACSASRRASSTVRSSCSVSARWVAALAVSSALRLPPATALMMKETTISANTGPSCL